MLEYTILVALIALVVVGAMTALGGQINTKLPDGIPQSPTTLAPLTTTTCAPATSTTVAPTTTTTTPPGC